MADDLLVSESAAQSVCQTYMLVVSGREKEAEAAAVKKTAEPVKAVTPPPATTFSLNRQEMVDNVVRTTPPKPKNTPAQNPKPASTAPKPNPPSPKPNPPAPKPADTQKPTAPPTPPPTPQAPKPSATPKPSKKKFSDRLFQLCAFAMWPVWGLALVLGAGAVEKIFPDGVVIVYILIALMIFFSGHGLVKSGSYVLGPFCLFAVSGWTVLPYEGLSLSTEETAVLSGVMFVLCMVTALCHAIRAR